ncbi:MAG: NADH-quinone oxidoreductase subunit C [Syntrophobacterales bacterium]|jgi:Ni,Fe-hydrogenase III large subunit|nr:NADH-quinone oxidoreductase subunit C [Syntrophobacterales bacterium]
MSSLAANLLFLANGEAVDVRDVSALPLEEFRECLVEAVAQGMRLSALFGRPVDERRMQLWAILADDSQSLLIPLCTETDGSYPSLTPQCPQAHWFEREIFEQYAVRPIGHPWLKPIRFQPPCWRSLKADTSGPAVQIGVTDFFQVEGEEIHEVAVGPVHAGIIEPGHFRFQCHGEEVLHLEISLGYQHRGVERSLVGGPDRRTIHTMETLAGDTTIGHATAYCQVIEALAGLQPSPRAEVLRGIALELERIANHTGDLGALAGDVGFLPTLSYCGRIRGDVLNMTGLICGNRFGRGLVRPGGAGFDLDPEMVADLLSRLDDIEKDLTVAIGLLWKTSSVMARFEGTGTITKETGERLGLVGPVARACGIERDVRQDMPAGIFRFVQVPAVTWDSGDVLARAHVRWMEIHRSIAFIRAELANLPDGKISNGMARLAPNRLVVSLVEGWRGEICHVALTNELGRFALYKVVDPSFHNWFGLAYALRGQQISDFPLCNKSFNLSYCGHDL